MLEACLTWPGLPGDDWVPTQAWSPPGCPTGGQLGHSGLHLSLRVPVGTDWPCLARGGAGSSGSESNKNKYGPGGLGQVDVHRGGCGVGGGLGVG